MCKSSRNKAKSTPQNHKLLDLDYLQSKEFVSSTVKPSDDVRSRESKALWKQPMEDLEYISPKKVKFDLDGPYDSDINFWDTPNWDKNIALKEKPIVHGKIIDLEDMESNNCKVNDFFEF